MSIQIVPDNQKITECPCCHGHNFQYFPLDVQVTYKRFGLLKALAVIFTCLLIIGVVTIILALSMSGGTTSDAFAGAIWLYVGLGEIAASISFLFLILLFYKVMPYEHQIRVVAVCQDCGYTQDA